MEPVEPGSRREIYRGKIFRVDSEDWPWGTYDVVHHMGASAVLPLTPDGDVILVRQFRPAIRRVSTEIPAGLLDREDEEPVACAARELFEETGYHHVEIELLGGIFSSAGFADEYIHLFVARTEDEPAGWPEEGIELVRKPFAEMVDSAKTGRVPDAKTALALLLAEQRWPSAHGGPEHGDGGAVG